MFQFVLLKFGDEGTDGPDFEVARRSWMRLNEEDSQIECKFPDGPLTEKQLVALVTKQENPPDSWKFYRCELISSYGKNLSLLPINWHCMFYSFFSIHLFSL